MNNKGQITVEYILLMSILVIIILSTTSILYQEIEKNKILNAAQIGAQTGVDKNGYARYYNDTFNNYYENYQKLLAPTEIKIIQINTEEANNTLSLEVVAHSVNSLTNTEKYVVGSRINYYVRKVISESFQINTNDTYYTNIKTRSYEIKTKNVKWV